MDRQNHPNNQRNLITDFIFAEKYDFYNFYIDIKTGTTDKRDGLKQLIKDAEDKKFDIIVVKELSRLGRNVELLYSLKRLADEKGIRIISLGGKVDTADPSKSQMFGLYAWIYEGESQQSSERIKSVFKIKQKQGKFIGSNAPYGYRVENGVLIPRNDETVEVVREIFAKSLEGWGPRKIATYLSEKGIPTLSQDLGVPNAGLYWHDKTIRLMLQNPNYTGDLTQGKDTAISVTTKKRKFIDKKEWVIVESAHEGIISKEIFNQVQDLLAMRSERGIGKTRCLQIRCIVLIVAMECGISQGLMVIFAVNIENMGN